MNPKVINISESYIDKIKMPKHLQFGLLLHYPIFFNYMIEHLLEFLSSINKDVCKNNKSNNRIRNLGDAAIRFYSYDFEEDLDIINFIEIITESVNPTETLLLSSAKKYYEFDAFVSGEEFKNSFKNKETLKTFKKLNAHLSKMVNNMFFHIEKESLPNGIKDRFYNCIYKTDLEPIPFNPYLLWLIFLFPQSYILPKTIARFFFPSNFTEVDKKDFDKLFSKYNEALESKEIFLKKIKKVFRHNSYLLTIIDNFYDNDYQLFEKDFLWKTIEKYKQNISQYLIEYL